MTTLNVTIQTKKAGQLAVYTIKFDKNNFLAVVDAVSNVKTVEDLKNSDLWEII